MGGGGVVSFAAVGYIILPQRLDFSRRGSVTSQDETGDPELGRDVEGEEVFFVLGR